MERESSVKAREFTRAAFVIGCDNDTDPETEAILRACSTVATSAAMSVLDHAESVADINNTESADVNKLSPVVIDCVNVSDCKDSTDSTIHELENKNACINNSYYVKATNHVPNRKNNVSDMYVGKMTKFSFLHWNVGGLLPKLNDVDFINYISSFDFICLVETFVRDFKSSMFDDFTIFLKPSVDLGMHGRDSGGVICLIRSSCLQYFKEVKSEKGGNFIAFVIDKQLMGLPTNILIVCAYVPPESSRFYSVFMYDSGISMLEDYIIDCLTLEGDMPVVVCGDLNARTADVLPECFDDEILYDCTVLSDYMNQVRYSKDKILNSYGKQLLNMCSALSLSILNGVCFGDLQGSYTFISDFGNSVNDYFLMSSNLFHMLCSMSVFNIAEQIHSQHMPLEFVVNRNHEVSFDVKIKKYTVQKFEWNDNFQDKFTEAVNSEEFKDKLNNACDMISSNIDAALGMFIDALKVCGHCMKKTKVLGSELRQNIWFDQDCKVSRRLVRKLLNKFKKHSNESNRFEYCKARREYKHLLYRKKRAYNEGVFNSLLEAVNDQKEFWSKVRQLSTQKCYQKNNISCQDWFDHFRKVLEDNNIPEDKEIDSELEYNEMLDRPISREEILLAIRKIKRKKAPGPDGVIGEFFKYSSEKVLPFLLQLFNYLFENGLYPDAWTESIILPLYKKGNPNDTNNYRGISLCDIVSKLYGFIVNSRLQEWVELNNITGECQAGFKRDYSTVDHIFTLLAMVQKQFVNNRKLYVAFIDFEKAFDSISRKLLWPILRKNGIKGKLYLCVRSMYKNVKARVRCGANLTDVITCSKGVKQGDICSPILFSLFINELALEILDNGKHGVTLTPDIIQLLLLLFADDIILLSETIVGLQNQLNYLLSASLDLQLKVNMGKSNVIVFRKGGFLAAREKWYFGSEQMKVVNCYKYLGIYFSTKLSFNFACQDLISRAKRAVMNILYNLFKYEKFSIPIFFKLFDSQIQPIVQYGAEVWGLVQNASVEKVHLFAMKRILAVDRRTPNDLIYGELGRYPIYLNSYFRCIRYWLKLILMEENRLPKKAYKMLLALDSKGKLTWVTNVRFCLCSYGFQYVWLNQGVGNVKQFLVCFKQRLVDCFWQGWNSHLQTSNRFDMYRLFKTKNTVERYLMLDLNRFVVYPFVKFRLGISCIAVHSQRYSSIVKSKICKLCHSGSEDEMHILFCCPYLLDSRKELIPAKYWRNPSKFRLALLLSSPNENIQRNLVLYVYKALKTLEMC